MKGRAARPAGRAAGTLLPCTPTDTAPKAQSCHLHPPGKAGLWAPLFRMQIAFWLVPDHGHSLGCPSAELLGERLSAGVPHPWAEPRCPCPLLSPGQRPQ